MMHRVLVVLALAVAAATSGLASGCGPRPEPSSVKEGAHRGEPAATLPQGGKVVESGSPGTPWSKKNRAERIEYMGLVFYPRMKELFAARGTRAAEGAGHERPFRCQTCHGENMSAASYAMPNGLYALPEGDPMQAALARNEATARFMAEKVLPEARALLGTEDPSLAENVTCHTCHERERRP
jgi:hypothetical protein